MMKHLEVLKIAVCALTLFSSFAQAKVDSDPARPWIIGKVSELKIDPMTHANYEVSIVVRPNYDIAKMEALVQSLIDVRERSMRGMWMTRTWTDGFGAIVQTQQVVRPLYLAEFTRMGAELEFLKKDLMSIQDLKLIRSNGRSEFRVPVNVGAAGYEGVFTLNKEYAAERVGIKKYRELNVVKRGWIDTFVATGTVDAEAINYELFNVRIEVRAGGNLLFSGQPVATDLQSPRSAGGGPIGTLKAAVGDDRAYVSLVQSHKTELSQVETFYIEEMRKGTNLAKLTSGSSCGVVFHK
jgi:hypothetical protein